MTGPHYDFLLESCSASGTNDYSLAGPPASTPYVGAVAQAQTGGVIAYIVQSDVTFKWEIGYGVVTDASPDTLTRNVKKSWDGVTLSNSAKVNWSTGDGALRMYCAPAAFTINGTLTHHRGTAAPEPAFPGMIWEDITSLTAVVWKHYDGADWITLPWVINETANTVSLAVADITQTSTDAGASAGPTHTLDRNSATPAAADELGEVKFTGRNSTPATTTFSRIAAVIVSATAAAEHGFLRAYEMVAGALIVKRDWHPMPRQTASSSAALTVDGIPSIANEIKVSFDLLNATSTANLVLTPRKSTGTDITTLAVSTFYFSSATTAAAAVASSNNVAGPISNNANFGGASGTIVFRRVQSGRYKKFTFEIEFANSTSGNDEKRSGIGHTGDAAALTGIKMAMDSGNIAEGYMDVEWRE